MSESFGFMMMFIHIMVIGSYNISKMSAYLLFNFISFMSLNYVFKLNSKITLFLDYIIHTKNCYQGMLHLDMSN